MNRIRAGAVLDAKYELEKHLARGGMGSIWIARDLKLQRTVAVKFIDVAWAKSTDARERFVREAIAVAQLRTAHAIQVYDHGLDQRTPFIVMEYLEGENLKTRLEQVGKLSFADTLTLLRQIARALRVAHEAGVIHRDLKPQNIFLARVDGDEVLKILDFGVAKIVGLESMTLEGEVLGSPRYMSPEQLRGQADVDHRSDVWSLGVILYRCLTGVHAFPGDLVEVTSAIRKGTWQRPSQISPEFGPEVDAFFARAMSVDPEGRFASVGQLAQAFTALAPPMAIPPPPISSSGTNDVTLVDEPRSQTGRALEMSAFSAETRRRRLAPLLVVAVACVGILVAFVAMSQREAPAVADPAFQRAAAARAAPPPEPEPPAPAPAPTPSAVLASARATTSAPARSVPRERPAKARPATAASPNAPGTGEPRLPIAY